MTWGGYLPTTGAGVVRYLAEYADKLSINTLKQRLAALAQWHITQGFPDPTKTPDVRPMINGIRVVHPAKVKQAAPLLLKHLERAVTWLEVKAAAAIERGDYKTLVRHRRSVAIILIGFWRGFRGDELARLTIEACRRHCHRPGCSRPGWASGGNLCRWYPRMRILVITFDVPWQRFR